MKKFIIGNTYKDRGPNYKRFDDDQFSSWLIDNSNKTIPPIGGVRFKKYVDLEMYSAVQPSQRIPPYIILISSLVDSEFDNPWADVVSKTPGEIIYWGDANGRKLNHMSYPGNKALDNVNFLLKDSREIVPPIIHFSKFVKGGLFFNGLCALDKIEKEKFFSNNKNKKINNLKCYLKVFKDVDVDPLWLVARANSLNPSEADKNAAPSQWIDYIESGKFPSLSKNARNKIRKYGLKNNGKINYPEESNEQNLPAVKKKRSLVWNDERNTVLMWILYHKGFSIADDSNPANEIIAHALDVKRTSLDMMARHIKHHLLRLDLYGKKYRGSASLKRLIDKYRPDLRKLRIDANNIAKDYGWHDKLKDFL